MTPIERAARAICVTFGYDPDKDDEVGLGEDGDLNWNMFEDHVRAVLTAIREPLDEIIDRSGSLGENSEFAAGIDAACDRIRNGIDAMIDAALAEAEDARN